MVPRAELADQFGIRSTSLSQECRLFSSASYSCLLLHLVLRFGA